jgi:hypothetical protein
VRPKLVIVGIVLMASLISIRATRSQDAARATDEAFVARPGDRLLRPVQPGELDVDSFIDPRQGPKRPAAEDFDVRAKFRKAQRLADELKAANEPDSKADATKKAELAKKLEAAVAAVFDADMTDREQRLTALEQRLNNLRSSLDRRRNAKAEIVQLEVKVLANEAAGLGFSTRGDFGLESTAPQNPRFQRWWRDEAPKIPPENFRQ